MGQQIKSFSTCALGLRAAFLAQVCRGSPPLAQTLRAEDVEVRTEDLARLSPARYEHINRLDKYTFPSQVEV